MNLQEEIKIMLLRRHMTQRELAHAMSEKIGKKVLASSLSQKLSKETLRFSEFKIICEILNYKIECIKNPTPNIP